jgi:hypothetical protein
MHRAITIGIFLLALGLVRAASDDDCIFHCPTRPGAFGSPEPDKECVLRCLRDQPTPPRQRIQIPPVSVPVRFTAAWSGNRALEEQRRALADLLDRIPDQRFRLWAKRSVSFDRVSQGQSPRAGVRPGMLIIYDTFWEQSPASQMNTLVFELGKALWFERVNPGPREARPPREIEFENLYREHQPAIEEMKFAAWRGENLGKLGDQDLQSWFAYACRVVVMNLNPPAPAPNGWSDARASLEQFIGKLLAGS